MNPAFQKDTEIQRYVKQLIADYKIQTVVETGTHLGRTAAFLAPLVPVVHTVEWLEGILNRAKAALAGVPNIIFYHGDSREHLKQILPVVKPPALIFLDAHVRHMQPVIGELDAIIQAGMDPLPILIIHDCKVPHLPQLTYEAYGDFVLSYENLKPKLDELYDGKYRIQYNDWYPTVVKGVGTLFVYPNE